MTRILEKLRSSAVVALGATVVLGLATMGCTAAAGEVDPIPEPPGITNYTREPNSQVLAGELTQPSSVTMETKVGIKNAAYIAGADLTFFRDTIPVPEPDVAEDDKN